MVMVTALIVAAGAGTRMGGQPKQFRPIAGKAVLAHAVDALLPHPAIETVRIVVGKDQAKIARDALGDRDVGDLVIGGATRSESVRNGLAAIDCERVLVHDAARPFCPPEVVDRLLAALDGAAGAIPYLSSVDTLARKHGPHLGGPVDREQVVRVQTPQAFRTDVLRRAYAAWSLDAPPTDEAQVLKKFGAKVRLVDGDERLEKLTLPGDFDRAARMLEARMISRTGMGFDVHAFGGTGPVILGGVEIAYERGLSGHSDADVCLHAITDALLGAAGLGDIGEHFPPSDPQWKGAASETFLTHAAELVREQGGTIDHVDATLICEAPKIGPHRDAMRRNIARILDLDPGAVSVKATTTEKLGFAGRGEGIACQAVATVRR